jgi:putative tryptophan/tyrosine transport system ATP-binding protein
MAQFMAGLMTRPMLSIRKLRKVFFAGTPNERPAIEDVDLDLEPGAFCVLVGSNGAGKSTLLNAIAGTFLVEPGQIVLAGEDIGRLPQHVRARRIARVFQDPVVGTASTMTVEENLLLAELRPQTRTWRWGLTSARRERYRERLSRLGLGIESRLGDRVDTLSGGQRQAVSLIMSVLNKPQLLLLDEHTAALDPVTADVIMKGTVDAIERNKITTLMVTHNMQQALDYGSRLVMMDRGRIQRTLSREERRQMTFADLVALFREKDDRIVLAR